MSIRKYVPLIAILTVVTFPALLMTIAFYITDNPSLRPLSVTVEKLAILEGSTDDVAIYVHVDWGQDRTGTATKADLHKLVSDVLGRRTDNYVFRFNDVPGDRIGVTFVVGPNRYGPYPPARMLDGIAPALVALDMTLDANI